MGKKGDSKKVFKREDHIDREDLSGEHPYGDSGQIIALIIFLVIWTLDSFIFRFSTFFAHYVPLYLRLIFAALFFALAGYLARSGVVVVFKEVRDPPQVINTGVFSSVRHPIYLASLLFYLGFFFTTLSLISLVYLAGIFIFYDYIASFEEELLEQKFGQKYINYKEKVPKWIPRIKVQTFDCN